MAWGARSSIKASYVMNTTRFSDRLSIWWRQSHYWATMTHSTARVTGLIWFTYSNKSRDKKRYGMRRQKWLTRGLWATSGRSRNCQGWWTCHGYLLQVHGISAINPGIFYLLCWGEEAKGFGLLTHYFPLLSRLDDIWWIGKAAEREISGIERYLPPEWKHLMCGLN